MLHGGLEKDSVCGPSVSTSGNEIDPRAKESPPCSKPLSRGTSCRHASLDILADKIENLSRLGFGHREVETREILVEFIPFLGAESMEDLLR